MPSRVKFTLLPLLLILFLAGSTDVYAYIAGDLDGNHVVDSKDLRILAWEWLDV